MNLKFRDGDLIVFLNQFESSKFNFESQKDLKFSFKKLFLKIKEIFHINFSGSYNIFMYVDKNIGIILEIKHDKNDFFDYDDEVIDMKIKRENCDFIFKIENDDIRIKDKLKFYFFEDNLYVLPKKLNLFEQGVLLENSKIVYGDELNKILKHIDLIKLDKIW